MDVALIGRQREQELLARALDQARTGQGSMLLLVGEAGIGKTRLAEAFAAHARRSAATVLWGGCLEDDWRPAYAPWIEALEAYVRSCAPQSLDRMLGAHARPLAQILPTLREKLSADETPAPLAPAEERLRLFVAVAHLLLALTQTGPVVLVLDDVHWADQDSLGLLRHVVRLTTSAPLMVVGTYRDPDPDRARESHISPLRDVLAVLSREVSYQRIPLRGLSESEVETYLAAAAGQKLPRAVVQAVYAETAGHPFYTREVFRHLVDEGKLLHRGGQWSTDFSLHELEIPDGVRQVIDRRVSRLSNATAETLRLASALGDASVLDRKSVV
jgi:predicted ATPase